MGTQVCQNEDPIFSEMGTKWGPSTAEWGPQKPIRVITSNQMVDTRS